MATYNTNSDFSTDAASTVTDPSNTTTVTGFTWLLGADNWEATVTTDATAIGEKYLAVRNGGSGDDSILIYMNGPGNIGTQTETDVLIRFRIGNLRGANPVGRIRSEGTDGAFYTLNVLNTGNVQFQRWSDQTPISNIGSSIAKSITTATWYWARVNVTSAGAWSWEIWSGDVGNETGTPDSSGTDTTNEGGYVGVIGSSYATNIDYDWFSVGTEGAAAPSPGGGGSTIIVPAANHYINLMNG